MPTVRKQDSAIRDQGRDISGKDAHSRLKKCCTSETCARITDRTKFKVTLRPLDVISENAYIITDNKLAAKIMFTVDFTCTTEIFPMHRAAKLTLRFSEVCESSRLLLRRKTSPHDAV